MHRRFRTRNTHGFTLIEVLTALLIVATAYTAFASAFGRYADTLYTVQIQAGARWVGWNAYVKQTAMPTQKNEIDIEKSVGHEYRIESEEIASIVAGISHIRIHISQNDRRLLHVSRLEYHNTP